MNQRPTLMILGTLIAALALAVVPMVSAPTEVRAEVDDRDSDRNLTRALERIFKGNQPEDEMITEMEAEIADLDEFTAEQVRSMILAFNEIDERKEDQKLPLVEAALLDRVSQVADKAILKDLREDLQDFEISLRVRLRLFDAICNDRSDDTSEFLSELTVNGDPSIRMLATEQLGERLYQEGYDDVLSRVRNDNAARVRVVAIKALVRYARKWSEHNKEVVQALIDLMVRIDATKGGGIIVGECAEGLKTLSGEDLGTDPAAWAKWWREKEKIEDGEEVERRTTGDRVYEAYGISTMSKQVVFVIDTSSSMRKELTAAEKKEMQGDSTTGDEKNPDGSEKAEIDWTKVKTKLDFAREELKRTIKNLAEDTRFTIIAYNDDVEIWEEDIVIADEDNKEDAIDFLDRLGAGNRTNIYGAINAAIEMAERNFQAAPDEEKKRRRSRRDDDDEDEEKEAFTGEAEDLVPDTIYFLTDGLATAGKYKGPEIGARAATKEENEIYVDQMKAMMKEIKERNRVARITIHTIGVGAEHDHWTLARIAKDNNGTYISYGK